MGRYHTRHDVTPSVRRPRWGRRSFTLIELLVVVAIIALLISILLPALKRAREQAKAAVCLSNMRQMGIAAQMYATDYREKLPPSDCPFAESPEASWWLNSLQPYARTRLLYRCPADRSTEFVDWNDPCSVARRDELRWASFSTNGLMDNALADPNYKPKYPCHVIWVGETPDQVVGTIHIHPESWGWGEDPNNNIARDRHGGRSNYLFVDGHVAEMKLIDTWDPNRVNLWHPAHAPAWWHWGMDLF